MSEEALIRAFAAALVELEAPAAVQADVKGFFVGRGVPAETAAGLPGLAAGRIAVYRAMVHGRMVDAVVAFLPKTAARIGRPQLRCEIARFIAEVAPAAPYFWKLTGEFLAWAASRPAGTEPLSAELLELARHEWSDAEVFNNLAGGEAASGKPMALDAAVQFDGTVTVRRYRWAVHRVADSGDLAAEPTALLLYRDRGDHQVRTLELTPRAAEVTERLLAGETLQGALTGACAALGIALDDEFLAAMASFFADLADRGALLGAV